MTGIQEWHTVGVNVWSRCQNDHVNVTIAKRMTQMDDSVHQDIVQPDYPTDGL